MRGSERVWTRTRLACESVASPCPTRAKLPRGPTGDTVDRGMFRHLGEAKIQVGIRPPLVYLDHCAVRGISSDPAKTSRVKMIFQTRGTLMFSMVNMLEMAGNSGRSYEMIRDMLDGLGPFWVPSDVDPGRVEYREKRGAVMPKSFFPPLNIFGHIFRALPKGTFSLGTALDAIHDQDFRTRAPEVLNRTGFFRFLCDAREHCRAGMPFPPSTAPEHSLEWIQHNLARLLIMDSKKIHKNDATDLLHAVVPLRYATILVLDKTWARYANDLKLKDGTEVFPCKEEGLRLALDAIEAADISKFQFVTDADVIDE